MAYSDVYNVPKKLQKKVEASANSLPKKNVPKNIIQHKYHYSKDTLVINHERDRCPVLAHQFHSSRYHRVSACKETILGKQELKKYENTYTPIKIYDIAPGVINKERILYAKAIVEKDMMTSLHTVIEDKYGGACKLCVYNLTLGQQNAFCKDIKIAILNPYYKKAADGMYTMRVDNPMEVILMQPDTPASPFILPSEHKDRGNKLFKEKQR